MRKHDVPREKRFRMHLVLIAVTLALVAGRIAVVINAEGDAAVLSANDRSRWASVAALVEHNTFAIDDVISIRGKRGHQIWDTIDKVRHIGPDGRLHYYSSKPTLLTTMVAGVYYVVHNATGISMTEQPIYMPRLLLLLINVPVMGLFLVTMMLSIEWSSASDFAKRLAVLASCFATMLTPFAISLNNHLFAAAATSLTLYLYLHVSEKVHDSFGGVTYRPRFWPWVTAGSAAAFAVACELPALSMFVLWLVLFGVLIPRSIPGFLVGATVVAVGIFGTNYWAHQSWRTPYAHRGTGDVVAEFEWLKDSALTAPEAESALTAELATLDVFSAAESIKARTLQSGGYEILAEFAEGGEQRQQQWKVQPQSHAGSSSAWAVAKWDDWYDYPGSYWRTGKRRGVDLGEASRGIYAFNATLGTYGIFSLTPIWLLMPLGLMYKCANGPRDRRYLASAIALVTVVCFAFYIARPEIDRNYGGVSVCFRWMLWLAPLWIYAIIPELNEMSESRGGRCLAIALLAASVFSVSTSLDSPWQSPWLYRFASFLGWLS
ncbi:hypothetical protein [Aporhodopirellula aestuarii]|uniref:Glycosyltransferase RgtA/B/C/D-like domain-containing protein n=1 Tax=Aporhodopirellula aestuarii TaxID=2950107 RepID=A0ABT0TZS7_9BACT|nr:hypothetical protein [Aporhodopirellula aestuarii]MCM2370070.1 hypothetical protein [Aporhodopirellula aestuarii]